MNADVIKTGIAPFEVELSNIRYFLREERTVIEWQDWLRLRVPKLKAVTTKVPARALNIGRWGQGETFDRSVLYTDLLTCLIQVGEVVRRRTAGMTFYAVAKSA